MAMRRAWFWRGYAMVYDLIWNGPLTDAVTGQIADEVQRALALAGLVGAGRGGALPQLLDIGCGTGLSGKPFVARGWCVVGVDPVSSMLRRAHAAGRASHVVRAGIEELGSRSDVPAADAVMLANVLQVHPDPARALDDAWRLVLPGGVLICAWPADGVTLEGLYRADRASGRPIMRSLIARILRVAVGIPGMIAGVRAHAGSEVGCMVGSWARRRRSACVALGTACAVTSYALFQKECNGVPSVPRS